MFNRRLCFDALLVLLLLKINDVNSRVRHLDDDSLSRLLKGGYRSLTILLPPMKPEAEDSNISDEDGDISPKVNLDEDKAYDLYAILSTTQESQPLDAKSYDEFEKTKQLLRQALRRRCQRLDSCVQKCPKKKSWKCTISCKKDLDDRDLCKEPEEPKCRRPKCGRTMPPHWLL